MTTAAHQQREAEGSAGNGPVAAAQPSPEEETWGEWLRGVLWSVSCTESVVGTALMS